jgi:hypothetical protein
MNAPFRSAGWWLATLPLALGCPIEEVDCAPDASAADCPLYACALVQITRVDPAGQCKAEVDDVCVTGPEVQPVTTVAIDPDGQRWMLPGFVRPTGWAGAGLQADEAGWEDWPPCPSGQD